MRDKNSHAAYEAYAVTTFTLSGLHYCTVAQIHADLASPQPAGTTITFSGSGPVCSAPDYEFWVKAPGEVWSVKRAYSLTTTFVWSTAGLPVGRYEIGLWARQTGSTKAYDTYVTLTYYLGS